VPFDDRAKVNDFNSKMLDHTVRGQKFYAKVNPPNSQVNQAIVAWNFSCDLKRTDTGE